jgi:Amt family ammonium transporter
VPAISNGDTAWTLISAALVLFMTPGLAVFYGGMIRGKNVLAMLMMNYIAIGVVTIVWVAVGASLVFSGNVGGGLIGDLGLLGLGRIGTGNEVFGYTVPDSAFLLFQLMFAIITPAVVAGAVAERMKFTAWTVFVCLWSVLVYAPIAHWVWGGGLIQSTVGGIDFAGGLVVEINSGASALALAIVLGPRIGWGVELIRPHNLPLTILGAGILWFGWFGFNAGSALAANGIASQAFMTTQVAAAVAATAWIVAETWANGAPTTLGFVSGGVAGLVAITPAAGFVTIPGSLVIGVAAGVICFAALQLKTKFRFDDSLDVVAVHLVGGIVGTLLLGFLASHAINEAASGGVQQFVRQAISVALALGYAFGATFLIAKVLDRVMGIRVTATQERAGLDITLHEEQAYMLSE